MNEINKWIEDKKQDPADCFCDVIMVSDLEQAIWDAALIPNGGYEGPMVEDELLVLLKTVRQYLASKESKAALRALEGAVAYYEKRGKI